MVEVLVSVLLHEVEVVVQLELCNPLGDSVVVDRVYRRCPLMVQGQVFPIDLLELPFWRFDIILAKVDCEEKLATLCGTGGLEVVVGEKFELLSNVISSLRAEKLVRKGCEAYLAYIPNADSREMKLDEMRAISDFLDVFLEELPELSPNREVEFGIELCPSTAPVTVVPYCIASKELKELKL
ncbi:RVP_2 domain-containing protein [Gossypium australe]|uniref:RVP_2 domain-containing protein n=1 Tax=Gossypium australe TaxID=47621 RepID=A0A5B6UVB4_9ROSI|nr:RVP_2 domain-containing protein [Gossypium australe]